MENSSVLCPGSATLDRFWMELTFASDVNWTNHIDNIVNAAFRQVNVLRKLKFTLSKQTLSNIYLTFIRPTLEYACEVWDECFEREVAKLEKVQLESAKNSYRTNTICK